MKRALLALLLAAGTALGQAQPLSSSVQSLAGATGGGSGDVTDVNITTSSPLSGGATCASGVCAFTLGLTVPGADTNLLFRDGTALAATGSGLTWQKASNALSGTGPWTLTPGSDIVPLTVRAYSSGTNPIIQWQTSGNGALGNIGHDGSVTAPAFNAIPMRYSSGKTLAIGSGALAASTGVSEGLTSLAIGENALSTTTFNQGSTALGALAGSNLGLLAKWNTAIGYLALGSATAGAAGDASFNTAVGYSALGALNAATADNNSAFGSGAMYALTSGVGNTALGFNAGSQLTTATNSTFLGASADFSSATQRTNATAIGYAAKVSADNQVVLGDTNVTAVWAGTGTQAVFYGSGNAVLGAAGESAKSGYISELLTLSTVGTTTNTSGNLALANSRIKAILVRVTTTITTATAFTVKVTGGNVFKVIGTATTSLTTLTAGTTYVLVPAAYDDQFNATATTLTVDTTGTPGAGAVRLSVISESYTAPSS